MNHSRCFHATKPAEQLLRGHGQGNDLYSNILAYQANLHSDRRRPQTIDQRNHKVEAAGEGHRANYWVRSGRRLKAMFGRKGNT
jgi:hypothetical protein